MASLQVSIALNGRDLRFTGDGDQAAVVAAFRVWLASPHCAIDSDGPNVRVDVRVDDVDEQAASVAEEAAALSRTDVAVHNAAARSASNGAATPLDVWKPSPDSLTWKEILKALSDGPKSGRELARELDTTTVPTYLAKMSKCGVLERDTRVQPFVYRLPTASRQVNGRAEPSSAGGKTLRERLITEVFFHRDQEHALRRIVHALSPYVPVADIEAELRTMVAQRVLVCRTVGTDRRWRRADA